MIVKSFVTWLVETVVSCWSVGAYADADVVTGSVVDIFRFYTIHS